jgi:hypothetical protein
LREYYPAALEAFDDLADRHALAVLGRAPTPADAARLSVAKIRSALKHAGRQRNIDARAQHIAAALRTEQLTAPAPVAAAFAATTRAAVGIIAELNRQISDLETELATHFEAHPDADIYLSLPGPGVILGAINTSPGARAFYDQHRAAGDLHHQALRALGNRLVGILHGCLRHHTHYSEHTAWAHRQITQAA